LFIGTRKPPRLLVIDTETGTTIARSGACGDTDDLFYDSTTGRSYLSGGDGCVDVFRQAAPSAYERIDRLTTLRGARTSLWVPGAHRLYVAVPHRGAQKAEVLVFEGGK
jgi:hypothetical protein